MRVLIVLPRQERATGNEVTAERHRSGLTALGHLVQLERVTLEDGERLREVARLFSPDLIHLLHAYRSGFPWLEAKLDNIPSLVTLTGTDINGGIDHPGEGATIRTVFTAVTRIVSQNSQVVLELKGAFPHLAEKVAFLPPGILLGHEPSPLLRGDLALPSTILFLHPAGIRPVKGNLELLHLFDPLAESGLDFVVAFCGPVLDVDYGKDFFAALEVRPWARYLGVIPPESMAATLVQVDIVLNNSQSEGLPNALLEAAALGVPMLVRAISGNQEIVTAGVNGLLYHDRSSFFDQAHALCVDTTLRQRLSIPSSERYSLESESRILIDLYFEAIRTKGSTLQERDHG